MLEFFFRRSDATFDVYPDDAQEGVIDGPDPQQVWFVGEPGELSLGVRTHELSLPAFFARDRARRTGRGVAWAMASTPTSSIRKLPAVIRSHQAQLRQCDLVVVMVGISDALRVMSPGVWERHLRATFNALEDCLPPDGRIVVGEIPPLNNAGSLSRPARVAAGIQGRLLNQRSRSVANDYSTVTVVDFPEELTRSLWRPESDEHRYRDTYAVWGAHLSANA
jgi:lysophospholipase L1-like esterase